MKKSRKALLVIGLVIIVLAVALGVLITTGSFRYEAVGKLFVAKLRASLGREVTISHVDGSIIAGISAHNVKMAPAGGNMNEPEMLADRLDISYKLIPMLLGKPVINRMEFHNFTFYVSRRNAMWSFQDIIEHVKKLMAATEVAGSDRLFRPASLATAASGGATPAAQSTIEIENIVMSNGRVVFTDPALLPDVQVITEEVNGHINLGKGFTSGDCHIEGILKAPAPGTLVADGRLKEGTGPSLEAQVAVEDVSTLDSMMSSFLTTFSSVLKPEKGKLDLNLSVASKQGVFSYRMNFGVSKLTVTLPSMAGLQLSGLEIEGSFTTDELKLDRLTLPLGEAGAVSISGSVTDFTSPVINAVFNSDPLDIGKCLAYCAGIPMLQGAAAALNEFSPGGILTITGGLNSLNPLEIMDSIAKPGFKTLALIAQVKSQKQINLVGSISGGGVDLPGFEAPLTGLEGDLVFDGFQLKASNLKGALGTVPVTVDGTIGILPNLAAGFPPSLSLTATVPGETTVKQCLELLPEPVRKILEPVSVDGLVVIDQVAIQGTAAAMRLNGSMSLSRGSFLMAPYLLKPLTGITATTSFDGTLFPAFDGTINITGLTARIGSSSVTASGTVTGLTELKLALKAGAKKCNLQDIAAHVAWPESLAVTGQIDTNAVVTGTMLAPVMKGSVTSGQGTVILLSEEKKETLKVQFRSLAADWNMKDQVMKVDDFTAATFQGTLSGNASFRFDTTPIEYTVDVDGQNIDLEEFSRDNLGWLFSFTGKGNFSGNINGQGNDLKSLLGNGNANLANANFKNLPKFRKYLAAIDVPWIAEKAYEDVTASFKLEDGKLKTKDLVANGKNINIRGAGSLGFDSTLDASVSISLAKAGLVGTKLASIARKLAPRANSLDFTLGVTGPMADLSFTANLEDLIKKALTNKLMDKLLGNVFKKKKEPAPSGNADGQEAAPAKKQDQSDTTSEEQPVAEEAEEESLEDKLKRKLLDKLFGR